MKYEIGKLIFRTDRSHKIDLGCNYPVVDYQYLGDWGANSERYPNRHGDECFICGTRSPDNQPKYLFRSLSNWSIVINKKDYKEIIGGDKGVRYLGTECANKLRKYLKSENLNPKDYILKNS